MEQQKSSKNTVTEEIQLVIFSLAGEEFGLDISQVREIIRMQDITPMPKAPRFIEGVINIRGQIIAVMDLAKRLNLKETQRTEKTRIIVAEFKENTIGMIVDEVPEVLRISKSNISSTPDMIDSEVHEDFIREVGILENRLIILLNIENILAKEDANQIKEVTKED